MSDRFDVVVLGAGPAGYVGAIRAAQLGATVALVEPGPLGGTCCNRGCIPTKALLQSARVLETVAAAAEFGVKLSGEVRLDLPAVQARKAQIVKKLTQGIAGLMSAHKVEVIRGTGRLEGPGKVSVGARLLEARHILIATGSEPARLPVGQDLPAGAVLDSTEALELQTAPRSVAIIGGGVVGVEFAAIFGAWGSEVTVLEALPQVLPGIDSELVRVVARRLTAGGVTIQTGARVAAMTPCESGEVEVAFERDGARESFRAEKVLVAVGRRPATADLGLEGLGVRLNRGFIRVDERGATGVPGIWAAGDVTGAPLLAHRASAQAVNAVEAMLGHAPSQNLLAVPSCVYTDPEIASVGLTEDEAKQKGIPYKVGRFGFAANGKALTEGAEDGLVKVIVSEAEGEILGVHIVGPHASAMISEAVLAIGMEATLYDVAAAIHPHPTLSEALPEALLDAVGMAVHKAKRPARPQQTTLV